MRDSIAGSSSHLHDIVDESKERRQREGRDEHCDEAVLDDYLQVLVKERELRPSLEIVVLFPPRHAGPVHGGGGGGVEIQFPSVDQFPDKLGNVNRINLSVFTV